MQTRRRYRRCIRSREYAVSSTGNVAPVRTIIGSNTGLTGADGILVDKSGDLYVANCTGCFQSSGSADSIFEFAPGANGNVAPIRSITGSNTNLYGTTEIFLDAAGNIYSTQASSTPTVKRIRRRSERQRRADPHDYGK